MVLRPDGNGGRVPAVVLGRGQFVGERAVINDRLRSADCVAQGTVQVTWPAFFSVSVLGFICLIRANEPAWS